MSELLSQPADAATAAQLQQRLLQLGTQLAQVQSVVDALRTASDEHGQQVTTLVNHFTERAALQPVYDQLAMVATALEGMQDGLEQVARTAAQQSQLERLIAVVASQSQVDELTDGMKKLTRTQFKSNTLAESKEQQVESALAALRELATRREQQPVQAEQRQTAQLEQTRRAARVALGADLLPALDSMELALSNGEALVARQQTRLERLATTPPPAPITVAPAPAPGFWQRLFAPGAAAPTPLPPAEPPPVPPERALLGELLDSTRSWLQGLRLAQERFLGLLAAEAIEPIAALNQPFDPKLHVALEAEARNDVAPNTVVRVLRQGYRHHDQILRYAEVVVARQPKAGE